MDDRRRLPRRRGTLTSRHPFLQRRTSPTGRCSTRGSPGRTCALLPSPHEPRSRRWPSRPRSGRRWLAWIPGVAVTMVTTQEGVRDRSIARERLLAIFGGGLAGLALLLSCVGLFGLMAYSVSRRTGEIGVRMALGATRPDVARPILREALLLAAAGAAIGLPLSLALTRLVTSQLFGVKPGDPLSMALALVAVLATAAGAAWIPAWRAQRIRADRGTEVRRLADRLTLRGDASSLSRSVGRPSDPPSPPVWPGCSTRGRPRQPAPSPPPRM